LETVLEAAGVLRLPLSYFFFDGLYLVFHLLVSDSVVWVVLRKDFSLLVIKGFLYLFHIALMTVDGVSSAIDANCVHFVVGLQISRCLV